MAKFTKSYSYLWKVELTRQEHEAVRRGQKVVSVAMKNGSQKQVTVTQLINVDAKMGKYIYNFDDQKPAPAPQPSPARAKSIERKSAGKADGYVVGKVYRFPNVNGGGGDDGHSWKVVEASKYFNDDNDQWMCIATVVPA